MKHEDIDQIVIEATGYPVPAGLDIFDIDMTMLDKEWITHPKIFLVFSLKVVHARRAKEEADAKLSVVAGAIADRIRNHPDKYGLEKSSEAAIKVIVPTRKKYKKYLRRLNDAKDLLGSIQSIVEALDHRRRGLQNLVELHGQQYFSSPRPLSARSKIVADKIVKQSVRIANRRKKRRRKKTQH